MKVKIFLYQLVFYLCFSRKFYYISYLIIKINKYEIKKFK